MPSQIRPRHGTGSEGGASGTGDRVEAALNGLIPWFVFHTISTGHQAIRRIQDHGTDESRLPDLRRADVVRVGRRADPIQATYSTKGTIGTTGITGTPDVSFQGVNDSTMTTGQPFSLGQFVVTPPPDGGTTTYGVTPFQIMFTVTVASGDPALNMKTPITLSGFLSTYPNGTVADQLKATFDTTGPLQIGTPIINAYTYWITEGGSVAYGLHPTETLITLTPTSQHGGSFGVQAQLDVYSTPEPSSLAIFVAAAIGLVLKCHLGRARCQARNRSSSGGRALVSGPKRCSPKDEGPSARP